MKTKLLLLAALLGFTAGSAFAADLTAVQRAVIHQEVIATFHGLLAAEERLDATAARAGAHARIFRHVGPHLGAATTG